MSEARAIEEQTMPVKGPAHPCPYLPNCTATFLYARKFPEGNDGFERLLNIGYRRSGLHVYRTDCDGCQACTPLRVRTEHWQPDRSQRRALLRNGDIEIAVGRPTFDQERADLFGRYLETRHDGQMSGEPKDLEEGLYRSPVPTIEITGRLYGRLVSVGIVDVSATMWSLVYSAWDPDMASRSLGTAYVGWTILMAKDLGIPYVHLGYWVHGSKTMDYKSRFQPHELLMRDIGWVSV